MAKGQVTDDELASGLKNFGGFGSLGGQKPRREDPFRDTRSEAPAAAPAPTRAETPRIEIVKTPEVSTPEAKTESAPPPDSRPNPLKLSPKKAANFAPPVKAERAAKPLKQAPADSPQTEKKTELYTERVTVPLDVELRDATEALAKDLQRKRTEKGERITANTVMRVALRVMLEKFDAGESVVNTEGELYQAVIQKVSKK